MDIHESGSVILGYSYLGPTISLLGVLRSTNVDHFVTSMDLLLVRKKDQSQHNFTWGFSQFGEIHHTSSTGFKVELPTGFIVTPQTPQKYNIGFIDMDTRDLLTRELSSIDRKWSDYTSKEFEISPDESVNILDPKFEDKTERGKKFSEFSKTGAMTNEFSAIQRLLYWEPGEYSVDVIVKTTRPDKVFKKTCSFRITDDDFTLLQSNTPRIVLGTCGLETENYHFVDAKYL